MRTAGEKNTASVSAPLLPRSDAGELLDPLPAGFRFGVLSRHRPPNSYKSQRKGKSQRTGVLPLLSPDDDGVAPEELKQLHRGGVELSNRVVIRGRLVNHKAVRAGSSQGAPRGRGGREDEEGETSADGENDGREKSGRTTS
jgi:hypothetical protein